MNTEDKGGGQNRSSPGDDVLVLTVAVEELMSSFSENVEANSRQSFNESLIMQVEDSPRFQELDISIKHPLEDEKNLQIIFKYLDGKSLLSARLVCKLWRLQSEKYMFKINLLRIPHGYYRYRVGPKKEFDAEMVENKKFIARFDGIHNIYIGEERDIELYPQLKILWKSIKYIKLRFEQKKEIQIKSKTRTLEKLMKLCPSLEVLDIPRELYSSFVDFCISTKIKGEFLTISELHLALEKREDFELLEKFAQTGVKMTHFTFSNEILQNGEDDDDDESKLKESSNFEIDYQLLADIMNILLISSKLTLKKFCLVDWSCKILPFLDIPRLIKLQVFEFKCRYPPADTENEEEIFKFHSAFSFSLNLPNLKEVKLDFGVKAESLRYEWQSMFDSTGQAPSVKILTVQSVVPISNKLLDTFCNIEELTLTGDSSNLSLVWKMCKNLKKLKLSIYLYQKSSYELLLANFTGFSVKTVKHLLRSSRRVTLTEAQTLVVNHSILSIPGLEKLTFVCSMTFETEYLPFLQTFALVFIPELDVKLQYYP